MKQKTLTQNITQKLIWGLPIAAFIQAMAAAVCFPYYFKLLFFWYSIAGIVFFTILDLAPVKLGAGSKLVALAKIVATYFLVALFYTTWGHNLAQFNPENEKEKINATLDKYKKLEENTKAAEDEATAIEMFKKKFAKQIGKWENEEMDEDELDSYRKLFDSFLKPGRAVFKGNPIDKAKGKVDDFDKAIPPEMIANGKKVFQAFECYNCHVDEPGKVTKRRGPNFTELHLGSKKTAEWMRESVLDPRKEIEKKYADDPKLKNAMPADYKDQMFEEDIIAVVAYLMSFK